eukprot:scaffold107392_cov45-Attheya_sp.AAC.3
MAGLTLYANQRRQLHDRPHSFLVILTVVLSCAWCTTSFSELVLFRRDQANQRRIFLNERVSSAIYPLPHSHSCISRTVSCFGQKEKDECDNRPVVSGKFLSSRRTIMGSAAACGWGVAWMLGGAKVAHAACLAGDTDPSCIGIYKIPLDEEVLKYIDTPENLARFAPDIKWVKLPAYPKTYKEATAALKELAPTCQEKLPELVLKGELTEAGVILLDSLPRLTLASRVVLSELEKDDKNKMRSMRAEAVFPELFIKLSQADILLGQAIRGELGVSAVAQIQILALLKDANQHWDELLPVLE